MSEGLLGAEGILRVDVFFYTQSVAALHFDGSLKRPDIVKDMKLSANDPHGSESFTHQEVGVDGVWDSHWGLVCREM